MPNPYICFFFFPYATLFVVLPQLIRGDYCFTSYYGIMDYAALWVALAFYVGTTALAMIVANRQHFCDYQLRVVRNAKMAFWGCLLFWGYCFPWFLYNWWMVAKRHAQPIDGNTKGSVNKKSVSVIIIAIWSMTWLILLSAAIPSVVPSGKRSNQAAVITALRNYASAQHWFAKTRGTTRYCDDFSALYHRKGTQEKPLISRNMADARMDSASTRSRIPNEKGETEYYGYRFLEDPFVVSLGDWENQFGLVAYPVNPKKTWNNLLWIGVEGTILFHKYEGDIPSPLNKEQSPLHPKGKGLWQEM